ncbi:hypothetical protein [Alicyclobacillus dauci]|uniref:Uncharacterized protein n=1 Tax=Alicyclobacillus dauci TaxID=1475485 RepID=A0ABY6Z6L1_9BACL|nr:hypothetical protein [Alicyclobacillus dauci]WAH38242.1 hypothetical protein NZD86_07105 [Alicyclobacillus dauci]
MQQPPMTVEQFYRTLKQKVRGWFGEWLREEEVYNSQMWMDGKVNAVASDGLHADVFINAASTVTASVPIANGITLAVGDEVVILNRAKKRDLIILYKKVM